jgi:hypothetical protein
VAGGPSPASSVILDPGLSMDDLSLFFQSFLETCATMGRLSIPRALPYPPALSGSGLLTFGATLCTVGCSPTSLLPTSGQ